MDYKNKFSIENIDEKNIENQDCISGSVNRIIYDEIVPDDEQKYAIDCVVNKLENVFITGQSGTGKTELIFHIVKKLQEKGDKVSITSANINGAISIGGKTIQNFSGFSRLDIDYEQIKKRCQVQFIQKIWNNVDVLIIDDISTMPPEEFKKILYISKMARTVKGHIQWVLLGDFLSLPPSGAKHYKDKPQNEIDYCIQLPEWNRLIKRTIQLTRNKRQNFHIDEKQLIIYGIRDPLPEQKIFIDILDDIRTGAGHQLEWVKKLTDRLDKPFDRKNIPFTKLFTKQEIVDAENESNFKKLTTMEYKFFSQKGWQIGNKVNLLSVPKALQHLYENIVPSINEIQRSELLRFLEKTAVVDSILTLRKGAVVILMATLSRKHGLIKGTQGIVQGFTSDDYHYPIVKFKYYTSVIRSHMWTIPFSKEGKMWYGQIPLKLGWGYNIYRMRGMTFDNIEVSMRDMFGYGQVYEVLSKVKTLDGINFTTVNWGSIKAHQDIVGYYEQNNVIWRQQFQAWLKSNKVNNNDNDSKNKDNNNVDGNDSMIPTSSFILNPTLLTFRKDNNSHNNVHDDEMNKEKNEKTIKNIQPLDTTPPFRPFKPPKNLKPRHKKLRHSSEDEKYISDDGSGGEEEEDGGEDNNYNNNSRKNKHNNKRNAYDYINSDNNDDSDDSDDDDNNDDDGNYKNIKNIKNIKNTKKQRVKTPLQKQVQDDDDDVLNSPMVLSSPSNSHSPNPEIK